jgi:hypothetical protein
VHNPDTATSSDIDELSLVTLFGGGSEDAQVHDPLRFLDSDEVGDIWSLAGLLRVRLSTSFAALRHACARCPCSILTHSIRRIGTQLP